MILPLLDRRCTSPVASIHHNRDWKKKNIGRRRPAPTLAEGGGRAPAVGDKCDAGRAGSSGRRQLARSTRQLQGGGGTRGEGERLCLWRRRPCREAGGGCDVRREAAATRRRDLRAWNFLFFYEFWFFFSSEFFLDFFFCKFWITSVI